MLASSSSVSASEAAAAVAAELNLGIDNMQSAATVVSRPASALMESIDASDEARLEYFTRQAELYQKRVPTQRGAGTDTSGRFIWTYRNTGCDVISVVTTTLPVRNGAMKDIKIFNKEMRRIKPSKKDSKSSPFEQGQVRRASHNYYSHEFCF